MAAMQKNHPQPSRLLALDPGGRRTGVAVSDELGLFAHPRPAIEASSTASLLDQVESAVASVQADEVVLGLPLSLSGADSEQTRLVRELAARLRDRLSVPVLLVDERLSSVRAQQALGRGRRPKGEVDSAAAAILLQSVLDRRRLAAVQ